MPGVAELLVWEIIIYEQQVWGFVSIPVEGGQ